MQAALAGLSTLAELVLGSIVDPDQGFFGQRLQAVQVHSSKPERPVEEQSQAEEVPGAADAGLPVLEKLQTQSSGASTIFYQEDATPRKDAGMRRQRRQWLRQHVLGPGYSTLHDQIGPVATAIYSIGDLRATARFDYDPFSTPHHLPLEVRRLLALDDIVLATAAAAGMPQPTSA